MKRRHVVTPTPPFWWEELNEYIGILPRLSKAFWRAISTSEDASIRALVFRCNVLAGQIRKVGLGNTTPTIHAFTTLSWHPTVLVRTLERVYAQKLLDRRSCNQIQDCILRKTDRNGNWQSPL